MTIDGHLVSITAHCVNIRDSYEVGKKDMAPFLARIESYIENDKDAPECDVFQRDYGSLLAEWRVHNFLYKLHIRRAQTKDVDLDNPCDKPEWMYRFIGWIAKPFIK